MLKSGDGPFDDNRQCATGNLSGLRPAVDPETPFDGFNTERRAVLSLPPQCLIRQTPPFFIDIGDRILGEIRFDSVREWLFKRALPFWARRGLDAPGSGFLEQLTLDGRPRNPGFKRLRTQARQTYVFSHAELLGWGGEARRCADAGWSFLLAAELPDGGFPRTVHANGSLLDSTFDLYDQAFVIYAAAWRWKVTGDAESEFVAHRTLDAIERRLGHPQAFGFRDVDPETGERLQNAHMHLLEASLAWLEISGDNRFKALAHDIVAMHLRFFQQPDGWLAEYFNADWRPLDGPKGRLTEPGHQYEWTWLLAKAGGLLGRDYEVQARRLHNFAQRLGRNPVTGLCWDCVDRDGKVERTSSRSWAQTERLKAYLAIGEYWGPFDREGIAEVVDLLLDKHLAWNPPGVWMDCFDANGTAIADHIPASAFYHFFLAFSELLRLEYSIKADM